MNGETRDERLRRLLREADPAADDPGLTIEEAREMRRTVLTAVPEPRRRWLAVPALAGAAVAALAVALALAMWQGQESPTVPPKAPNRIAAVPRTEPVPAAPAEPQTPAVRATPERPPAEAPKPPRRRPPRRKRSGHRAPVSTPMAAAVVASETHQIQFATPGGTRIIWVLTSDKTSG
jgi:hypothetical protein